MLLLIVAVELVYGCSEINNTYINIWSDSFSKYKYLSMFACESSVSNSVSNRYLCKDKNANYVSHYYFYYIILGVQISSVRFFVFKNAFISKQNEWTDQLKYCPSLPTTFSHLSEFHLEKMTHLWRRSNFGANFRFLRKKWTGDLLYPSEQPVIRRSNVRRIWQLR